MAVSRVALLVFAALCPIAASAQLVVRDGGPLADVVNPAKDVRYPPPPSNCNNTIADAGARAVVRAIDGCPETFFESRYAYLSYARQAVIGLLVPGATEAAGALIVDKAKENALFCISGALIDESGATDADKVFLKALVAEAKETLDRQELKEKLGNFRKALKERGAAGYLDDGESQTFVKTLDVTLSERYEGRVLQGQLIDAGRDRYDTAERRSREATTQARELGRQCQYAEAAAGLAQAQQANLAYLAELRQKVSNAEHFRFCLDPRRIAPVNALNPASPFLRHSIESADADIAEAKRRDAEQTALIGQLAELEQSFTARRNDIDALKRRAARQLETANQAAGRCDFAAAENALDTLNKESLECALLLDAERRSREEVFTRIGELKSQLGQLETEVPRALAVPFEQINSCGELSAFADGVNQIPGECRTLAGIDAKVAALRQRARECSDYKSAAIVQNKGSLPAPGALLSQVTVTPPKLEENFRGYTRSNFSNSTATWEREDRQDQRYAKVEWTYAGVPGSLSPGQSFTITVTGGVTSERPPGAGEGLALSGVVAVYGDITATAAQQADRAHPTGRYDLVVSANPQNIEIHLGGAPMGTGAIYKYSKAPGRAGLGGARTLVLVAVVAAGAEPKTEPAAEPPPMGRTLKPWEDPNVPHDMGTPRHLQDDAPAAPTPPLPPVPTRYVGCFKDAQPFDLDGHLEAGPTNTPQACAAKCASLGFRYAGLQDAQSCLCGNKYGRYGPAKNCDHPCTGDAKQMCGGANANSVYDTAPAPRKK